MGSVKNCGLLPFLQLVGVCVVAFLASTGETLEASATTRVEQDSAPPPKTAPQLKDQKNPESAGQQPEVKLIEAGQAPHRALRLRPTVGYQQRHELEMSMSMESDTNGQAAPRVNIPTVKYTLDSTVTEVTPEGDISFTVEYSDASVVDNDEIQLELLTPMEEMATSMIGLKVKSTVDYRGFAKGVQMEIPDGMPATAAQQMEQLSKSLEQLTSPFPVEPVGVGGKWKVVVPMNSGGIQLLQTMEYTVLEMANDVVTLTVDISQQAEEQELELPEAGLPTRLTSLECQGTGRLKLNLSSVLADESSVKADVTVVIVVEAGQEFEVTQDVTTEAKLKAVPRPSADTDKR
ncbi:MAG: hypothetical protein JNL67_19985 [Planctomycetaceae bacterium]|nr:hypothetical protein [Planctomycetaceae bacterium]